MIERTVLESTTQRRVLSATPESSAYDAACQMAKANCGSILILDAGNGLHGIFTERDLMTRVVAKSLIPENTPLADVMTPNPYFVSPETRVHEAVFLMKQYGIRHLPVLSPTGSVIGVFSLRDALPGELRDADDLVDHIDQQFTDVLA